jgi:hypothetical protein
MSKQKLTHHNNDPGARGPKPRQAAQGNNKMKEQRVYEERVPVGTAGATTESMVRSSQTFQNILSDGGVHLSFSTRAE